MIGRKETLAALRRAVEKKGKDHKVNVCHYFHRGNKTPVCIVGHVISDLGLKELREDILRERVRKNLVFKVNHNGHTIDQIPAAKEFFTPEAIAILDEAQRIQDGRHREVTATKRSWGDALTAAAAEAKDQEL